jgi:hypothetical protein
MASYIERRKFLATLLGGAAAAWSLAARAQHGVLINIAEDDAQAQSRMEAFLHGLRPDTGLQATSVRHAKLSLARRRPSTHECPCALRTWDILKG